MIDPVLVRFDHIDKETGKIGSIGGRSHLIADDAKGIVRLGKAEHGLDEIVSVFPEHPRNAHDEIGLEQFPDGVLARKLALPVFVEGGKAGLVGAPRSASLPVEHVIGGKIEKLCARSFARSCDIARTAFVDGKNLRDIPALLGSVDRRPCGAVDDGIRLDAIENSKHGGFVRYVELGKIET